MTLVANSDLEADLAEDRLRGRLRPGIIVEHEGARGVTVPDGSGLMACCSPDETPVVFYGQGYSLGTPTDKLVVIGREDPRPEPRGCGAGRGAECCKFLTAGPGGFCCERHTDLRMALQLRKMTAERQPTEPFPECMKFR